MANTLGKACALALMASLGQTALAQDNWGYSANNGPSKWADLSSGYALCRAGRQQSPIDIEGTDPAIMHALETDYTVTPVNSSNSGRSLTVSYTEGSFLKVGNKLFELESFEFHAPGEHTIAGVTFPLSIHFIHQSATGEYAVIAVNVVEGKENLAAKELYENIPLEPGQTVKKEKVLINARDLMPSKKAYYRYMGSLTTPPCSEGVNWYVLKDTVEFSKDQISLMSGLVGGNNARPVQKRNNRIILDALPQ